MYQEHNQELHDSEIGQFLEALRIRASTENISARSIYEDLSTRYPNAALEISQEQTVRAVHYVRQRCNPPIPDTLSEMGQTITSVSWQIRLLNVIDDNFRIPFFQCNLEYLKNNVLSFGGLIFANMEFLHHHAPNFRHVRVLAVDRSFGVLPHYPADIHQLVTIHVLSDNISVPVMYAILNGQTEDIYIRLWQFLRNDFFVDIFEWNNLQIITDFETEMRNAIRSVIPESRLIGCWFHYSQNIIRYIKAHNLIQLMRNNPNVAIIIGMIIALPYLPSEISLNFPDDFHIVGGFMAIQTLARTMDVFMELNDIFEYVQHFWIECIKPDGFSVFRFSVRLNNYIESFHSMLKITIGQHPPVWTFWDRLRSFENMVRKETQQIINGQQVRRSIITLRDTNNTELACAIQYVRNGRYTTMAYLQRISYSSNGYLNKQLGPILYVPTVLEPLTPPLALLIINDEHGRRFIQRGRSQAQDLQNYRISLRRNLQMRRNRLRSQMNHIQQLEDIEENIDDEGEESIESPTEENVHPLVEKVIENREVYKQSMKQVGVDQEVQPMANNRQTLCMVDEATAQVAAVQIEDEYIDRCFICLCDYNEVQTQNILLPCGHGWCCDGCGERLKSCPICLVPFPRLQPIRIMHVDGCNWTLNYNLSDPNKSHCLGCLRYMKDVPNIVRYIYLNCGHGWFCSDCAIPPQISCEICNESIEGIIQIYLG